MATLTSPWLVDLTRTRFTEADAQRAFDTWGSNCGPGAIAARRCRNALAGITAFALVVIALLGRTS